jgi:hypothetical protein
VAGSWSNAAQSLIVLIEEVTGYSGIFGYSPAPGTGTLVFSLAAAAGTDPYGNAYPQGLSIGSDTTRQIVLNYNGTAAAIDFSVNNGHGHSSGGLIEQIFNPAAGTANTAVTFNKTFSSTPVVMVTPSGNGPGVGTTTKLEWQTTGASTTGFNCRILRDNTTATTLSWFAVLT